MTAYLTFSIISSYTVDWKITGALNVVIMCFANTNQILFCEYPLLCYSWILLFVAHKES